MRRLPILLAALASTAAFGKPLPHGVVSSDFTPNPAFVPSFRPSRADNGPAAVEQVGEVVVLEGDEALVTDDGMGNYGIYADQGNFQPPEITSRFFTKYADEFDEVVVFTTFFDNGSAGALAYEMSTQQDVRGIGRPIYSDSGSWGSESGTLHAFVNMKYWNQFQYFDGIDITDPRSSMYNTLGQEFAHRWLSFLHFKDANGQKSDAMLGRDKAHWASTLQADASVMDGDRIVDNGDGSFTNAESNARYSMLDLYGMGLLDASEVPAWFLVQNAVDLNGKAINPAYTMRVGKIFRGNRVDITIDDVVAAEGKRVPAMADAPHAFRVAFVLVTRPGEHVGDVVDIARTLDLSRLTWEKRFSDFTGGRGAMCTQVSAPCGNPTAKLVASSVTEIGGNANGVIEPGEPVQITFTVDNDGPIPAAPVSVNAASDAITVSAATATLDMLAPGEKAEVSFTGLLPKDAQCGVSLRVNGESTAAGHKFRGFADVVPGLADLVRRDFEDGADAFAANADKKDSTTQNGWQIGTPVEYRSRSGWVFQPDGCHRGSAKCWFTGLQEGQRATTQSSVGVGTTSLTTPPIDVSKSYKPRLSFAVWYQAIDFSNPQQGGQVVEGLALLVEGSADGGKTWVPLDSIDGSDTTWRERSVELAGKIALDHSIQVRFSASSPDATTVVEAGIDDFAVVTQTPACNPNADTGPALPMDPGTPPPHGCACDLGRPSATGAAAGLPLVLVALLLGLLRRRKYM